MEPRTIATAIGRLRARSLSLLDRLSDAELERPALPGWSVADVFRHLADSDRGSVLGVQLLEFLPGKDLTAFERTNDENLERLRGRDRATLRDELATWGRRLQRLVAWTPAAVARRRVPTAFGRVPLSWLAALRVYDEWVHQWDVHRALDRPDPARPDGVSDVLAWFQLTAVPADALRRVDRAPGVVEIRFEDAPAVPAWRFDLGHHHHGPDLTADPTATVTTDTGTFSLVAADRIAWRDAPHLRVTGRRSDAARLLDVIRVV